MSDTVEVCSRSVDEQSMSNRLRPLEYAIVTLSTPMGAFVSVLSYVRMSHVVSVSCSRVFL